MEGKLMRVMLASAAILAVLLGAPNCLRAARPIVVSVQHDATFENLGDYPTYEFYLGASGWHHVQPGTPTRINLPEWEGLPLYLYAIPRQDIERRGGFLPDEWLATAPPGVWRSVDAVAVRYETNLDFDIIGRGPAFGGPDVALVAAGFWAPTTSVREPPPGSLGPIVPYRYLSTYRVTMLDHLDFTVVSERTFDGRGNLVVLDGSGQYILAPEEQSARWGTALFVAMMAVLALAAFLRWRYRGKTRGVASRI
jgi:hypothetical protein